MDFLDRPTLVESTMRTKTIFGIILLISAVGCEPVSMRWRTRLTRSQAKIDARTTLLTALSDRDPYVRAHAVEAVGRILGTTEAGLIMHALKDPAVVVRNSAVMTLSEMKYTPAKPHFESIVLDRKADQRVVCAAIYGLARMGENKYLYMLPIMLTGEFAPGRAAAAEAIGRVGDRRDLRPLRSLFSEEQDPAVRLSITEAMARLGDGKSQQVLEAEARGVYVDLRIAVIPELVHIGTPNAERTLVYIRAHSTTPPRVRLAAAGMLAKLGCADEDFYEGCVAALEDPEQMYKDFYNEDIKLNPVDLASLRRLAALALGNIGWPKGVAPLHASLNSPDGSLRVASALAILKILSPAPATAPAAPITTRPPAAPPRRTSMNVADAIEAE
jgi:HEAT repeat protein